jgi:hypothetical protein
VLLVAIWLVGGFGINRALLHVPWVR